MSAALLIPSLAQADSEGHGLGPEVWLAIAAILIAAKLGSEIAVRLKQPPVLGEIFAGIVLGNLHRLGIDAFEGIHHLPSIEFLAELGVVLLLFEVGLESTVSEMKRVAPMSGAVAVIGVIAPMGLGYAASYLLVPGGSTSLHLFVGATLCATSVGITARVMKDLNALSRPETRVILGAAVIDDVLGLMILAVVSAIAAQGAMPPPAGLAKIVGLAFGFLAGALLLGAYVMPGVFFASSKLRSPGVLATLSIGLCFVLAGISAQVGLAAIVGAFAAGLILDEVHVTPFGAHSTHDISEFVAPIVGVMAPIFFVRTGAMVDLGGLSDPSVLLLAAALSVVAVIGKLVSGFGVRGSQADRLTIGVGMIPRGEVGLIFANVGASIQREGVPLIDAGVYAAVVLMVMMTTVVTPPWLAARMRKLDATKPLPAADPHANGIPTTSTHPAPSSHTPP